MSPAPLIDLIDSRIALVDSLNEAWATRRAPRERNQQAYRDKLSRNINARLEQCRKVFGVQE